MLARFSENGQHRSPIERFIQETIMNWLFSRDGTPIEQYDEPQSTPMKKFLTLASLLLSITFAFAQTAKLPGMTDWFIPTGDWNRSSELYVREFGTGTDTVIMLHGGWGADHEGLINAVAGLSKQFHFVFYDQRGSLRSPFPDSLITYDAHINDVELVRKALRLNKIKLVGHSMGGFLAASYASKYPDRIKVLVLLAPANLKIPIPSEDLSGLKQQSEKFNTFYNRPESDVEFKKYNLLRPENELSPLELNARFRIEFAKRMLYDITKWSSLTGGRALYKGNVFGLTEQTYPTAGWDLVSDLSSKSFPVRIITGDHDFLDYENLLIKKWIAGKKQFTFTQIPKAGHLLWIDQPDLVTKELAKALTMK